MLQRRCGKMCFGTCCVLIVLVVLYSAVVSGNEFVISRHANTETLQPCADVVTAAYQTLGINTKIIELPGRRALLTANAGETDAELCRIEGLTAQYPNLLQVAPALFELKIVALSINPELKLHGIDDLRPLLLGSIRGMKAAEDYFQHYRVMYVSDAEQVVRMLDNKMIDVAILPLSDIQLLQKQHYRDDFIILKPPLFTHKMFHYLHRRHRDILPALEVAIKQVQQQTNEAASQ